MSIYKPPFFKIYLGTIIAFIPIGSLCLFIWMSVISKPLHFLNISGMSYELVAWSIFVLTYKYFVKTTVFLIMFVGLFIAERMSDNFKSSEFIDFYTHDSFSWNPLKLWRMFIWRRQTVEEEAKARLNQESWEKAKSDRDNAKLQKEKEFQDAVSAKMEELKARQ